MDLGSIIPTILENFTRLVPVRIIHSYEQGVKFRFGRDIRLLHPGIYAYWPFFENIETDSVATRFIETPLQDLVTKDDIGITVAGSLGYSVIDFRKHWVKLQDREMSVQNMSERAIARAVPRYRFNEIREDLANGRERHDSGFQFDVCQGLVRDLSPYGIQVDSFGLTTLTRAKPYRVIIAGSGDREPSSSYAR